MTNNDIAIKVENLSKYYKLGVINNGTLFKDIQSWVARKRGKEDPHALLESKFDPTADGFWALKDLNFEIKKGDRVGIVGHNGAGKSTLLKILSQITAPTEGTLKISGKISSLLEVGTGFHPELTGRENIFMNGAILGMTHAEIDRKVDQIIEFSEIGEHIDTPVKRYSSGMYVRLAFAVAAHLDSDILIADEVLAVGDASFQKKALGKMNELSTGEGRTVLFVSHNMAQVKALCNKGMVLEKGKLKLFGNLDHAINLYLNELISIDRHSLKTSTIFSEDANKKFQLLSACVLNSTLNKNEVFEAQQTLYIQIDCILREKLPNLYGYFSILTENNEPVISFDSRECKNDLFYDLAVGKHLFNIKIREGMLSCGNYYFYANFTSNYNNENFTVDSPLYCCRFTVVDTFSIRGEKREAITSYIPEIVEL